MRHEGTRNLHDTRSSGQSRRAAAGAGVAACLLLLGAGCADAPREEPPEAAAPPPPAAATAPVQPVPGAGRPDSIQGSISLEGMEEPMTYRLYRSPQGFPLPFSTYLPGDMRPEAAGSGEGAAVRFTAHFAGQRNDDIFLLLSVPSAGLDAAQAARRVREVAESYGRAEPISPPPSPWAVEAYRFRTPDARVGRVMLGSHAGRYFYIVEHYPAEAGDGFGPRARRILDEWRWGEGGARLGG